MVQGLNNDIIMSKSEVTPEGKDDVTLGKEDQDAFIEETEEYKEVLVSPVRTPQYILGFLEENSKFPGEHDYWSFFGPPIYDSSRPSSNIFESSNSIDVEEEVNMN